MCFDLMITSCFFICVMLVRWHTHWSLILLYAVIFLPIDGTFLSSNLVKVETGGW